MTSAGVGVPPEVGVVVMAFNEVQSLASTVEEIAIALAGTGRSHEILLVDDGSTDGTGELADSLAADHPAVRVIHHASNQGLGGVYRTGFRCVRAQFVTFFPADGQFPASIIPQFLREIESRDMVLGYLSTKRGGAFPTALSWCERRLYQALFGKLPRFQGIVMFRRELLGRQELKSSGTGWAVLMELIIRAHRRHDRLISVPTEVRPRQDGVSKVNNLRTIRANLVQLIALKRHLG